MLVVGRHRSWWHPPVGFLRLLASFLSLSERNPKVVGSAPLPRRCFYSWSGFLFRASSIALGPPRLPACLRKSARLLRVSGLRLRAQTALAPRRRKSAPALLISVLGSGATPIFFWLRFFASCPTCLIPRLLPIDDTFSTALHFAAYRRKSITSLPISVPLSDASPIALLTDLLSPVFALPYRPSPPRDGVQLAHAAERAHRVPSVALDAVARAR